MAGGEVDGGAQRLVEAGWVLGKDEVEPTAPRLDLLLPAECRLDGFEALRDERRLKTQRGPGGKCGERVVSVVEAAEWKLDADAADAHPHAVESLELDVGRGQVRSGAGEVAIGTGIDPIVAHVHSLEDQARTASRGRPPGRRAGGVVQPR